MTCDAIGEKKKEQSLNLRQEQSWSFFSTYIWYVKERIMDVGTAEGDKEKLNIINTYFA